MPNEVSGWRAPIAAISWRTILVCSASRPPPPYSLGQCGTVQPLSRIRSNQTRCGSEENLVLRPPQNVSSSEVIGRRISGGQLASSQARVSRRNFSRSDIGVSICIGRIDLSHRMAEFNISLARPCGRGCGHDCPIGCIRKAATIEKQEETDDAPEVAFAWRNERGPETNLRRIDRRQARRAAAADDGLAQQPGDGAARHAPGRRPAVRHDVSGQAVGDRDPGHRAALDLALRMVRPQAARAEGRHGSEDHRRHPAIAARRISTIPRVR